MQTPWYRPSEKIGFMIINPDVGGIRANVKLESEWLLYKKTVVYLGVLVFDNVMY